MARASQLVDLSYEAWLEAFFAWKPINGRPGGHIWAAKDKTSTIVNTVQIHVNNTNTYISVKMHYKYNGPPIPYFFWNRFQFNGRAVGHIWPHHSGMPRSGQGEVVSSLGRNFLIHACTLHTILCISYRAGNAGYFFCA